MESVVQVIYYLFMSHRCPVVRDLTSRPSGLPFENFTSHNCNTHSRSCETGNFSCYRSGRWRRFEVH